MGIPALIALAGGILAAFWMPSRSTRSLIQHFAAGVVLAALAVELLPEISREHAPGLVLAGSFALGSLFMYALKLWTMRMEYAASPSGAAKGLSTGLLLATFIDVATDGFIIGAGFVGGAAVFGPGADFWCHCGVAQTMERTHSWMNRFHRILVRWEKLPQTFFSMLHLACAVITWRATGLLK